MLNQPTNLQQVVRHFCYDVGVVRSSSLSWIKMKRWKFSVGISGRLGPGRDKSSALGAENLKISAWGTAGPISIMCRRRSACSGLFLIYPPPPPPRRRRRRRRRGRRINVKMQISPLPYIKIAAVSCMPFIVYFVAAFSNLWSAPVWGIKCCTIYQSTSFSFVSSPIFQHYWPIPIKYSYIVHRASAKSQAVNGLLG